MDGQSAFGQDTPVLGRVVRVAGSAVVVLFEAGAEPRSAERPQMGDLVKVDCGGTTVFGVVRGLSIPLPDHGAGRQESLFAEIELLGEIRADLADQGSSDQGPGSSRGFERGVSVYPGLDDQVRAASQEDLIAVYAAPASRSTVRVGTINQDSSLPAYVVPDRLLGRHFSVLGSTGAGKSCAMALILQAILEQHGNAHIVLLDPHNEYPQAFGDRAEILDPASLELPYWLFNFDEIVQVILGDDRGKPEVEAEANLLGDLIPRAKRSFLGDSDRGRQVTVDSPVPYGMSELINLIDEAMGKLDRPEKSLPYTRLKARINALKADSRFDFLFGGIAVRDNLAKILSRIFRVPVDGKPITIVDLSGVPSEILNVVVSVLCRMTFDFALWSDGRVPILLVCEEAHRYAPKDSRLGFEPTKRALSRIAKEGRKYGVSLGLVTQRPAELDAGILSQCNTIFALRMTNQSDREVVGAALADSAAGLLDFVPSLKEAEAIAIGEGVPVPVRMRFDTVPEERRPRSSTAPFSVAWTSSDPDRAFLVEVVERWRSQRR